MKIFLLSVVIFLLAVIGERYAEKQAIWYANAAVGLPQPDLKMPDPVPPEQQKRVTKFSSNPNIKRDGNKLVLATPEAIQKQETADSYFLAASICRTVKWFSIPFGLALAVFSFVRVHIRRAFEQASAAQPETAQTDAMVPKGGA